MKIIEIHCTSRCILPLVEYILKYWISIIFIKFRFIKKYLTLTYVYDDYIPNVNAQHEEFFLKKM